MVEDDEGTRLAIRHALGDLTADIVEVATAEDAYQALHGQAFACMIVDLNLGDSNGFELLERIDADQSIEDKVPAIIYTGQVLDPDEYKALRQRAHSIVIKGADSPQRLVDEVSLFLHSPEASLPEEQKLMIRALHSEDDIVHGKKILVVDDDFRNTLSLSRVLEEAGAVVVTAEDGQSALDQLASEPNIDLVLMDIMMPGMDGFECTRRIRAQVEFASLPVIAVTAKAMREDRELCLQAGADHYLTKPIDMPMLWSALRIWLHHESNSRS